MSLFSPAGPLRFIAIRRLGFVLRSKKLSCFITDIIDWFSNLTRAFPWRSTITVHAVALFLHLWAGPYGIPLYVLTENGTKLTSNLFPCFFAILGLKLSNTTAYHRQTNGQARRDNLSTGAQIRHYLDEKKLIGTIQVFPLTYRYSCYVHQTTGTTCFSIELTLEPSAPVDVVPFSATGVPNRELQTPRQKKVMVREKVKTK